MLRPAMIVNRAADPPTPITALWRRPLVTGRRSLARLPARSGEKSAPDPVIAADQNTPT